MQKGVVFFDGGIQGLFVYICLQVGCSPLANSFWPLGHPIPSPHFTYEAGGAGIQL
jgi:hypothetical protein